MVPLLSVRDRIGVFALLHKRIKVDIAFITQGMYVAQLDRSWLETPFTMRGFEITDQEQIKLLRKFCKYVYIDVTRSSVPKEDILEAHASEVRDPFSQPVHQSNAKRSNGRGLLARLGLGGRSAAAPNQPHSYRTRVAVRKEIPNATAAYGHVRESTSEIIKDVKYKRGLNLDRLKEAVTPMVESVVRNPDAMAWVVYLRNDGNFDPCISINSAVWAVIMGRYLGFDRRGLINLAMGGVLLKLGNILIPESLLSKDGPPTDEEAEILKNHVKYGVKIAGTAAGINDDIVMMIGCHHERHDGSGYPNELAGEDIPVYGRIAGLVNCYDEMISRKPYGAPKSSFDAICELNGLAGTRFQKELVEHFVQAVGMFPTGSLVQLNTGQVGIVVGQNQVHRLRPKLMLVQDEKQQPLSSQKMLDLSKVPSEVGKRKARWINKGHEAGAFGIDPGKYLFGSGKTA